MANLEKLDSNNGVNTGETRTPGEGPVLSG